MCKYNSETGPFFNSDKPINFGEITDEDIQHDQDDTIDLIEATRRSLNQNTEARYV